MPGAFLLWEVNATGSATIEMTPQSCQSPGFAEKVLAEKSSI
jgi:hypothetical protein